MENLFSDAFVKAFNKTTTENGAVTNKSTECAMLDYFAVGGAMRNMQESQMLHLFGNALADDRDLALKAMFYFRDIRGGQGQRGVFRTQLKVLATTFPKLIKPLIKYISEYGRWDDLYALFDTPLQKKAIKVMKKQLVQDLADFEAGESISLLAKWMKSENASSKETKRLARITRTELGFSSKENRVMLSKLRKHLDIVERHLTKKEWSDIDYSAVPSQAMMKYKTAFYRNDESRFDKYIQSVTKGKETINASTLYPAQIVDEALHKRGQANEALDALWAALPDYTSGRDENSIAVVDVSYSMNGLPMSVAISLGLYLAERASGVYKNKFITFSGHPEMVSVRGETLTERVRNMSGAAWAQNTDIEAVFELILQTAIQNDIPKYAMIDKLYIISDMEFDQARNTRGWGSSATPQETLMESIRAKFNRAGYDLPKLVFWNADARNSQFPMTVSDAGVQMVSGYSPVIFESLMKDKFLSAYELMVDVLEVERYSVIKEK